MDAHDLALAYSLSSVAGLRAALTILAVSIAVHAHAFAPPPALAWLGSDTTLYIVAALAIADFAGDKIPIVDHALHAIHTVLAPAAGGIAAASLDPTGGTSAGVVGLIGAANALGIHGIKSATRVGTSAVSFGFLTPVVSLIEDVVAVIGLAIAFVAPFVLAALALCATVLAFAFGRRIVTWMRRKRAQAPAA
jgi:hypothetical protein